MVDGAACLAGGPLNDSHTHACLLAFTDRVAEIQQKGGGFKSADWLNVLHDAAFQQIGA